MKTLMRQAVEMTENEIGYEDLERLEKLFKTQWETQRQIEEWKNIVFSALEEEGTCYINEEDIDLFMDYRKALWFDEAQINLTWK